MVLNDCKFLSNGTPRLLSISVEAAKTIKTIYSIPLNIAQVRTERLHIPSFKRTQRVLKGNCCSSKLLALGSRRMSCFVQVACCRVRRSPSLLVLVLTAHKRHSNALNFSLFRKELVSVPCLFNLGKVEENTQRALAQNGLHLTHQFITGVKLRLYE